MPVHARVLIFGLALKEHYVTLRSFPFSSEPDLSHSNVCSTACAGGDFVLFRNPSRLSSSCWPPFCLSAGPGAARPLDALSTALSQSLVAEKQLRACPPECDAFPHARTLPPGCSEICLALHPPVPAPRFLFPASLLLCLRLGGTVPMKNPSLSVHQWRPCCRQYRGRNSSSVCQQVHLVEPDAARLLLKVPVHLKGNIDFFLVPVRLKE